MGSGHNGVCGIYIGNWASTGVETKVTLATSGGSAPPVMSKHISKNPQNGVLLKEHGFRPLLGLKAKGL